MKGLFVKDLRLMKGQKNFFLVLVFMLVFFSTTGMEGPFLFGYIPFMMMILTMSTITYDEFDNGLPFLMTLPINRNQYVYEKYLLGASGGTLGLLFAFLLQCLIKGMKISFPSVRDAVWLFSGFFVYIILFLCLMIPIQLKYGSERGRMVLFGIFLGIIGIGYLFQKFHTAMPFCVTRIFQKISSLPFGVLLLLILAIFLLILYTSVKISLHIMEKKEW